MTRVTRGGPGDTAWSNAQSDRATRDQWLVPMLWDAHGWSNSS